MTLVDKVERIRKNNNGLWMDILRTALKHSPKHTKRLLKGITENDRKISDLLGKIAK